MRAPACPVHIFAWVLVFLCLPAGGIVSAQEQRALGPLGKTANCAFFRSAQGQWGIAVTGAGSASILESAPVCVEFYHELEAIRTYRGGYDSVSVDDNAAAIALAEVAGPGGARFSVADTWTIAGQTLRLARLVTVHDQATGGFLSGILLAHSETHPRQETDYFAPGMIYGGTNGLAAAAIGGKNTYTLGQGIIQIREDRLPAPMFGVHFADGSALTVLDPTPDGASIREDSHSGMGKTLVDAHFRFGSVGVHLADGHHAQGFWFPGSEGEMSYNLRPFLAQEGPLGWSRRYHPIRDGLTQSYRVDFRFSEGEAAPAYFTGAWRWVFAVLDPRVVPQDLSATRRSLVDVLAAETRQADGRAGIPNYLSALPNHPEIENRAIMGFIGKNLEAAEFLLADADLDPDPARAGRDRRLGLAIFDSFTRLKLDPPAGEGFDLQTGVPAFALPRDGRVYLRSFGDDLKATLRACLREQHHHGRTHPEWLSWARGFGDWLLTQQEEGGGFPRAWRPGTGEVADPSPNASYDAVPFLVLLFQATGDPKYLAAASRAAEACWLHGQSEGRFVGGTIDNPDVIDKEAGTLSLEAYLALYGMTGEGKWLERASAAADYAETWMYLWNVPMPADEADAALPWKRGRSTVGTQLIATGHSGVDEYMAFDVDSYARLASWCHDAHYRRVAALLLHNTKLMTALPGRTFDLRGPGWQQEHWSFAPARGFGSHRGWLPWVTTSQLKGIFGLMEFDPALYRELAGQTPP